MPKRFEISDESSLHACYFSDKKVIKMEKVKSDLQKRLESEGWEFNGNIPYIRAKMSFTIPSGPIIRMYSPKTPYDSDAIRTVTNFLSKGYEIKYGSAYDRKGNLVDYLISLYVRKKQE